MSTSIESAVRMRPSTVTPPKRKTREKVRCGCCGGKREQATSHPILGPLCVWCAYTFTHDLDAQHRHIRAEELCSLCLEGAEPCDQHRRD